MRLFWEKGFEATSMQDVVDTLGLSRQSLYNAFGDKEALFLKALDRYDADMGGQLVAILRAGKDPVDAITAMFARILARLDDPALPRGCLLVNTTLECPLGSPAITQRVARSLSALEAALYDVLRQGDLEGRLRPGQDPRALARFFVGLTQGMAVMAKVAGDPAGPRDVASSALSLLRSVAQ